MIARTPVCLAVMLAGTAFAATTPPIKVTPASAQVRLSASQSYTVSGLPAGVKVGWQVAPTPSSKPDTTGALGVVDANGRYTAPAKMPSPNTVTIQLVNSASAAVLASSAITLLNPVPHIEAFTPNLMNAGLTSTIAITGSGFVPGSVLMFDGKAPAGKFVVKSATEIDYTDTPAAEAKPQVTVVNPTPDGKISNARALSINAAVTVTLAPANATVRGGVSLTLRPSVHNNPDQRVAFSVNGRPNGDASTGIITTDAKGSVLYTAPWALPGPAVTITATSVADPKAQAAITVNLQNPTPVITAVSPNPLVIGSTPNITITGQGFAAGATVSIGGQAFAAQFVSPTTVTATGIIVAVPGRQLAVTVSNPAPGPLTSAIVLAPEAVAKRCAANGAPAECMNLTDATRFLEMASWGPSPDSVAHLQEIGRDSWLAEQFAKPSSAWPLATSLTEGANRIQQEFFNRALMGDDQLRQRVAFALSQIFVVSAVKDNRYEAMRTYIGDLSSHAFDSYRNLLETMTLNPAMGWYLDMVNNDKANPAKNTVANENYARESMQLFSIGLTILNPNGTEVSPAIPSYDRTVIPELAKVFTGWTYPAVPDTQSHWKNPPYFNGRMEAYPEHHDITGKTINLAGQAQCIIPANGTPAADLKIALDCLANHPNVGPFLSYRLIQRLVKSSPSPGYVQDVASVFRNSGGNLQAVVQAILTHSEAMQPGSGKLREPVLYATSLLRALNASVKLQASGVAGQTTQMGQQVLYAPTVFNYFSPSYRIPVYGVVAPEFQILNAASGLSRLNFAYRAVNNQVSGNIRVELTNFLGAASDAEALIAEINQAVYHGAMPANLHDQLKAIAGEVASETTDKTRLVKTLLYFAAAAPQYQVQQ